MEATFSWNVVSIFGVDAERALNVFSISKEFFDILAMGVSLII